MIAQYTRYQNYDWIIKEAVLARRELIAIYKADPACNTLEKRFYATHKVMCMDSQEVQRQIKIEIESEHLLNYPK